MHKKYPTAKVDRLGSIIMIIVMIFLFSTFSQLVKAKPELMLLPSIILFVMVGFILIKILSWHTSRYFAEINDDELIIYYKLNKISHQFNIGECQFEEVTMILGKDTSTLGLSVTELRTKKVTEIPLYGCAQPRELIADLQKYSHELRRKSSPNK